MPTNVSEQKRIEHTTSQVYLTPDKVALVEEQEELDVTVPDSAKAPTDSTQDTAVETPTGQKLPHFYERKIRVRKYDFL